MSRESTEDSVLITKYRNIKHPLAQFGFSSVCACSCVHGCAHACVHMYMCVCVHACMFMRVHPHVCTCADQAGFKCFLWDLNSGPYHCMATTLASEPSLLSSCGAIRSPCLPLACLPHRPGEGEAVVEFIMIFLWIPPLWVTSSLMNIYREGRFAN